MASEDSDQILPGLLEVHRLGDLSDLHQTFRGPVTPAGHNLHAEHELLEVALLGGPKRMTLEERNDPLEQVIAPADDVLMQVLLVVVGATIDVNPPDAEELHELLERVIPFFEAYPLRTAKQHDFEKFARCMQVVADGRHLAREGLIEIARIAETMNHKKPRESLIRILRGHTPDIRDSG